MSKPRVRIRDGKVVIRNIAVHEPQPNIVKYCEDLLSDAKRGEINGVLVVCSHPGSYTSYGYAMSPSAGTVAMVGRLHMGSLDFANRAALLQGDSILPNHFVTRDEML